MLDKALWVALNKKNIPEMQKLLDAGADPNSTNPFGTSLLMRVVNLPYSEEVFNLVEKMIDKGADVNHENCAKDTALIWSVNTEDHTELMTLLLSSGADIYQRNENGYTAIDYANPTKNPNAYQCLVNHQIGLEKNNISTSASIGAAKKKRKV